MFLCYNSAASELVFVCVVNKLVKSNKNIKSQMLLKYCTCIYYWRFAIESVTELALGVMSVQYYLNLETCYLFTGRSKFVTGMFPASMILVFLSGVPK